MFRTAIVALLLSTPLAVGQSPSASAAWAWATATVEPVETAATAAWAWAACDDCHCGPDCNCQHGCDCKCTQRDCYMKLSTQALAERKPIIVGVGCEPKRVPGALACRWDQFPDTKSPAIVVGVPDGADLLRVKTLSPNATEEEVRMATKMSAKPTVKLQPKIGGDPISGMTFPASISQLATPCANGQCGTRQ